MNLRIRLLLPLLLFVPSAALAQSARDFQLPPEPEPREDPDVQGPVDTEGVVPVRPRAIPTATPTPTPPPTTTPPSDQAPLPPLNLPIPQPSAAQTQQPGVSEAARVGEPTQQSARRTAPAQPAPDASAPPERADPSEITPDSVPEIAPPPVSVPLPDTPLPESAEPDGWSWWIGVAAALALGALGGVFAITRRRKGVIVPQIERPAIGGAAAAPPADALNLRVEALKLSRSVMNATLFYRVTVLNRSQSPLSLIAVEADLTSAHGETPMEQQVAGPQVALEQRHQRDRLAAGQSARFEGQIVLPLAQARLLRQGRLALLVPLLRLRATAAGVEPVARTLAIGPAASGGGDRLVPFRLDEGPRSYEPLAQKAIA